MPHFHIDYSPNLERHLDISEFCKFIRDEAIKTGVFPTAGIRVRATACNYVAMADDSDKHAFLDISCRLGADRTDEAKRQATDAVLSRKVSSIRNYFPKE